MLRPKQRTSKPKHGGGGDDEGSQQGIKLPTPILVHENDENWHRHHFTADTACHVISEPVEINGKTMVDHTFYINADNASLKTEMKYSKQDARLLEAKFKYANVLLGLAMLHDAAKTGTLRGDLRKSDAANSSGDENGREAVVDTIRRVSAALAPVLLPTIDQLSGLTEESLEEVSASGEDA